MNTAYDAIRSKAADLALPLRFPADLAIHDYNQIKAMAPGTQFAWAIGDNGTWIAQPGQTYRNGASYAATIAAELQHVFFWDGTALTPMTLGGLATFLAKL